MRTRRRSGYGAPSLSCRRGCPSPSSLRRRASTTRPTSRGTSSASWALPLGGTSRPDAGRCCAAECFGHCSGRPVVDIRADGGSGGWRSRIRLGHHCGVKVLVTGGTGLVGSHTAAAIVRAGHDVRLLVRRPEQVPASLGPLGLEVSDVVVGDVLDERAVSRAVEGCAAVVHEDEGIGQLVRHAAGGQRLQHRQPHHPDQRRVLHQHGVSSRRLDLGAHDDLFPGSGGSPPICTVASPAAWSCWTRCWPTPSKPTSTPPSRPWPPTTPGAGSPTTWKPPAGYRPPTAASTTRWACGSPAPPPWRPSRPACSTWSPRWSTAPRRAASSAPTSPWRTWRS